MKKQIKELESIPRPGKTPVRNFDGLFGIRHLFMKDETANPTHTFKDRLAYEMLRPLIEDLLRTGRCEKTTFGSISYGNTAFSMGYYCEKLNEAFGEEIVRAVAFMPPKIISRRFGPDTEGRIVESQDIIKRISALCGVIDIDLEEKIYRESDLESIARMHGLILDRFVDITEGLNRTAYVEMVIEAMEAQLREAPDYVIVPFGAGILCNEIIDYVNDKGLRTKVIPVSSGDPNTIAIMLYGPTWVDTDALLAKGNGWTRHDEVDRKGRKRTPYLVHHVKDEEIVEAMKILGMHKISAEASGAGGFAILPRLKEIAREFNAEKDKVLVINTGNGLLNHTAQSYK